MVQAVICWYRPLLGDTIDRPVASFMLVTVRNNSFQLILDVLALFYFNFQRRSELAEEYGPVVHPNFDSCDGRVVKAFD